MTTFHSARRLVCNFLPMIAALAMVSALPLIAGDPVAVADSHLVRAVTTQQDIDRIVAATTGLVLIDFHASWCGPCQHLAPELRALAATYPQQITVVTVDVDDAPELAQSYQVETIPHLVLMRSGKPTQSRRGFATRDALATWVGLTK